MENKLKFGIYVLKKDNNLNPTCWIFDKLNSKLILDHRDYIKFSKEGILIDEESPIVILDYKQYFGYKISIDKYVGLLPNYYIKDFTKSWQFYKE